MATHSSTLAWRIPWTEEPGGLQSIGLQGDVTSQRVQQAHWAELTKTISRTLEAAGN